MDEKNGALDFDYTFPHSYDVQELRELPGSGGIDAPLFYIPEPKSRTEHDGLWLKIRSSDSHTWIGIFAFGSSSSALSRVLSTPDAEVLCVVSGGAAYVVRSGEPKAWQRVRDRPIIDVRVLPDHQMLLLASFTTLTALGKAGVIWESPSLCGDDLKIVRVTPDAVEGIGYDPAKSGETNFAVDINTGRSLLLGPPSEE